MANAGGRVVTTIEDTGIGIPEEELPHIFDRFYRVEATSPATDGTGLGLAIVKRVAELHGGEVDVASTPGEGVVFRPHLPLGRAGRGERAHVIPPAGRRRAA